ncbi:13173_t:CDS:10 [Dentiscutata heterogama]|uniref:13173_t:CDS:1 n=1 Tax=Dentiscutata heterogama TaxID=1316150 RepID=A0ACA9KWH4_9GLOM|nr:13173_t:CDS:10 [Dentiscutata heterogama]
MKSKKQKKITRRERKEFLSPLYIPPAKKKDSEGPVSKIIQYKYEFNLDWYLLTFKDHRRQPEWQQYRNLEGCNEMIRDFWIREEAGANPMVGPFGSSKFLRSSTQSNRRKWTGSLEKGQNKSFLATVLLKPYPGHCHDLYSLFKIIGKTLWIRDSIPISYAKEFIQPADKNMSLFTIEAAYDDDISKLYIECALMEWSEKAGIVWIDESMSSFYIIFPNSDTIYLNFGCLTRPTATFFAIFKTLPSFQSMGLQPNYIPHLMNLKDLPNCKFIGYGDGCWPPDSSVNLEEWFLHGGFITLTAQTFNKQDHIFDRLHKVFQYQSALNVSSTWKVVICKNVEDNLAKNFEKFRCRQSLISSRMIQLSLKEGSSRYFETDELFYPKKKLNSMSIIKSLSFHMIKLHNKHWKKKRHFIIICEPEEKYNDIISVPGVDRLTLKEFELKFGSSERILLQ